MFGIVIDAFAELRNHSLKVNDDKMNKCFICGVKREQYEKSGNKFDDHVIAEHNMWTYVEYMIGLKFIDKQETNAINSYVMEEVERKQIGWVPCLEDESEEKEDEDEEGHGHHEG